MTGPEAFGFAYDVSRTSGVGRQWQFPASLSCWEKSRQKRPLIKMWCPLEKSNLIAKLPVSEEKLSVEGVIAWGMSPGNTAPAPLPNWQGRIIWGATSHRGRERQSCRIFSNSCSRLNCLPSICMLFILPVVNIGFRRRTQVLQLSITTMFDLELPRKNLISRCLRDNVVLAFNGIGGFTTRTKHCDLGILVGKKIVRDGPSWRKPCNPRWTQAIGKQFNLPWLCSPRTIKMDRNLWGICEKGMLWSVGANVGTGILSWSVMGV